MRNVPSLLVRLPVHGIIAQSASLSDVIHAVETDARIVRPIWSPEVEIHFSAEQGAYLLNNLCSKNLAKNWFTLQYGTNGLITKSY